MARDLDILAFGAHPDDVEISMSGTLALQASLGYKCGIVDLTRGEMGTRGTPEIRDKEAARAAEILGAVTRENLRFADGLFENDFEHQREVIKVIRRYRPKTIIINAPYDRHPDHGRGAEVVKTASFLAGLRRIETELNGEEQEAYRPQMILHYIQFQEIKPDIIVDVSDFIETKIEAIKAYESQFYDPQSKEPETVISSKGFLDSIRYRSKNMGRLIGVEYGEGFVAAQDMGISDVMQLKGVR